MKRDWGSWIKAAGVRALKTVAQTALGSITAGSMLHTVDWWMVLSASLMAGISSLLMSLKGLPELQE